jgi:hypothetical protein
MKRQSRTRRRFGETHRIAVQVDKLEFAKGFKHLFDVVLVQRADEATDVQPVVRNRSIDVAVAVNTWRQLEVPAEGRESRAGAHRCTAALGV